MFVLLAPRVSVCGSLHVFVLLTAPRVSVRGSLHTFPGFGLVSLGRPAEHAGDYIIIFTKT